MLNIHLLYVFVLIMWRDFSSLIKWAPKVYLQILWTVQNFVDDAELPRNDWIYSLSHNMARKSMRDSKIKLLFIENSYINW